MKNIRIDLQIAFNQIDLAELNDIVIAIGKTGSGKSTLLSAMISGPDILEIKIKNKRKVIDFKDGCNPVFSIGHSLHQSHTFLPSIFHLEETGLKILDIAGLDDSDGNMVEYINQFINKKIFNIAKKIRFMLFFT